MKKGRHKGHFKPLPLDSIDEVVEARPKVACTMTEVEEVLKALGKSASEGTYIPPSPTKNKPLSDDYVFDGYDEKLVLQSLTTENFVGKIKDLSKGAKKRKKKGKPKTYQFVFKFACKLLKKQQESKFRREKVLIYIKIAINTEITVVSFHKNIHKD